MKTFKDYYNKNILGVREVINFLDFPDMGDVMAKIDTGNEAHNVLHGVSIKDDGELVSFNTVNNKRLTLNKADSITIHIGSGVKEERPVVRLSFKLGDTTYRDIPFSIADRTENEEPVLIGEPFLKQTKSVVDSNK
jgi:hypothetical protein